jgi:chorismate dehydratase
MAGHSWTRTIGRVSFLNCDPLFHGLDDTWNVLPAPPSWLTGHLLRRDCVLAPIPAADYAKYAEELVLIPDIGICSKGEVGSVLLFSNKKIGEMKSIALPSDSATSVALLKHLLGLQGLSPTFTAMGPDYDLMLDSCDGALLIGDRALESAKKNPSMVQLDLGQAWLKKSGKPMVFGVFAARKDTPRELIIAAHNALESKLTHFENSDEQRRAVINWSISRSDLSYERLDKYFGEVFNRLDEDHLMGLNQFLEEACNLPGGAQFCW